uniref:Class I SAM-dependent methyltransferase n=1 Tax=Schlesneria paludicola TaxID=360056 RepID=A0A7C4LPX0_9PLAN
MSTVAFSETGSASTPGVPAGWAQRLLLRHLARLRGGEIVLEHGGHRLRAGTPGQPSVAIRVHRAAFFWKAVLGGTLSVAESYLRGDWDCDDLTALFRLFARDEQGANGLDRGIARVVRGLHRLYHLWRDNTRSGSRANIAAHYDLGNDLFALMLDETWAYSSGIFRSPNMSLSEASREKFDRVCRKLDLRPDDHLLEIGTGWGGFALHAALHYGCRVTTTTISRQQYEAARQRVEAAGLADRVTLLLQDYRDVQGQFDKLASIEMIEAVGHRHLPAFFRQCGRLLKPNGTLVLQAIVMPDQRYQQYLRSVDFIQRYVFPGGCLPSLGAMLGAAASASDLRLVHAEDFAPHYAQTLREWRRRFEQRLADVYQLGYDERFVRLWRYYLCYCEAAFEERCTSVMQLQFDQPACRRDPLRIAAAACGSSRVSVSRTVS